MSKKTGICYVCQNCGYKTGRWLGRCPECQAWQTLLEEQEEVHPQDLRGQVRLSVG